MPQSRLSSQLSEVPRWLDALIIVAVSAMMMAWTWRTWPDPLVDFGRELYVPWQLSQGHKLYTEIAYFNGPLSPYLNSLWMRIFGVSVTTIVLANTAILAGVVALLYFILNNIATRLSALLGALLFVTVFAFARIVPIGNYNWICPYSHELTQGIALSLAALACLHLPRRLTLLNSAITGLLFGLVLLTKVEVAFACGLALVAGFGLRFTSENAGSRLRQALAFTIPSLIPAAVSVFALSRDMSFPLALRNTFASFYFALFSNVSSSFFYRVGMGVDRLGLNLLLMLIASAGLVALALAGIGIGRLANRATTASQRRIIAVGCFTLVAASGFVPRNVFFGLILLPRALPVLAAFLLVVWIFAVWRPKPLAEPSPALHLRIAFALFALALLGKIFFNARLIHYGFALELPAALLLLCAFVTWLPRLVEEKGGNASFARAMGLGLICAFVFINLQVTSLLLENQRHKAGKGTDAFYGDRRSVALEIELAWINQNVPPNATIAVLPEGAIVNYLARRRNSTPYITFLPPEMMMFGESNMLQALQTHPPDYVLLCHRDTSEYGVPFFGTDYAQPVMIWLNQNYQEVTLLGNRPFKQSNLFGMVMMRRR